MRTEDYGTTYNVAIEKITHYARLKKIEFQIIERDENAFVYGFDIMTTIKSRRYNSTFGLITPPSFTQRYFEWRNLGGVTPSQTEINFFQFVCKCFAEYGTVSGSFDYRPLDCFTNCPYNTPQHSILLAKELHEFENAFSSVANYIEKHGTYNIAGFSSRNDEQYICVGAYI